MNGINLKHVINHYNALILRGHVLKHFASNFLTSINLLDLQFLIHKVANNLFSSAVLEMFLTHCSTQGVMTVSG